MGILFNPHDLSKNELAAQAIRFFGSLRMGVTGSSMLPTIQPEDVLLIRRCRIDEALPGDIVLYLRYRRLFAHRVISRSAAQLLTQGDALDEADLPVAAHEFLGKVARVMRRGKSIRRYYQPGRSARMAAALFRRSPSAGRLFIRLQGLRSRVGL